MGEKIIMAVVALIVAWFAVTNAIDCYTGEDRMIYIIVTVVLVACWLCAQTTKKK